MARKRSTGSRFQLGEPYDEMLDDFCAANFRSSATEVVRQAVLAFIQQQVRENPGIRSRYEAAQRKRTGETKIALVKPREVPE